MAFDGKGELGARLKSFQEDGLVWPVRVYGEGKAERLLPMYEAFQDEMLRRRGRQAFIKTHLVSTWLDEIVHNDTVLDTVEAIIGPDILIWTSDLIVKEAGKGKYVGWHQDLPYYELSTNKAVSAWLALTPSTRVSGCMRVLPGTHVKGTIGKLNCDDNLWEAYAKGHRASRANNLISFEHVPDDEVDDARAQDVELQPGEMSVHHCQVIHGGSPNTADYDRIGFVMRFISADTYCHGGRDTAMLLRGRYRGEHFDLEPRPKADFHPDAMRAYDTALAGPGGFGDRPLK